MSYRSVRASRIAPSNGSSHNSVSTKHSRQASWLTWAYIVALHIITSLFFYGVGRLHSYIHSVRDLAYAIQLSLGNPPIDFFPYVMVTCDAIAICHGLALLVILMAMLKRRWSRSEKSKVAKISWLSRTKDHGFDKVDQWSEYLEKKIGADIHQLEIIIEVLLQTFQAYKMSSLVAVVWINRLLALVIVANCWFIPLVQVLLRKRPSVQVKILLLVFDSLLDAVYAMVIPLAIFYPYCMAYDTKVQTTPRINSYMDTWTINTTASLRQISVTSWLDLLAKMAPGFGLLFRLVLVQKLAERVARRQDRDDTFTSRTDSELEIRGRTRTIWKKRIVNLAFFLWGLFVLILHLTATTVVWLGHDRGYLLEIRPFGSTEYTWAVFEVSCNQKGIRGIKEELDIELKRVDAGSLVGLIIAHCPTLSMPSRMKSFPRLQVVKIHNSTLVEWGPDAALTSGSHPTMNSLHFTLINMSGIPDGLLSPDFPPTLYDVQLSSTNLTGLPPDLFSKSRPHVVAFILERSPGIDKFPRALLSSGANTDLVTRWERHPDAS